MNWKCKYEKFLMMILWMCSHSVLLNTVWYCFWMSCFKTKNRFVFFCRRWKAKWFCHFIGINLSLYKKKKSKRIIIRFWLSCWYFHVLVIRCFALGFILDFFYISLNHHHLMFAYLFLLIVMTFFFCIHIF